jgi:O-methyltransferase
MIKNLAIRLLSTFNIPLTLLPFLYSRVLRDGRTLYRPFYQPWIDDTELQQIWTGAKAISTSQIQTFYFLGAFSKSVNHIPGDFVECGVYKGGSALLLGRIANEQGKSIHLFDTFSGMPERTEEHDSFEIGSFSDTSIDAVRDRLKSLNNVTFHKGTLPQTLLDSNIALISFAHIDVDQYISTKACLQESRPRLANGGIVIVDDYGRPGTPGARLAVAEICAMYGREVIALPTGQGVILWSGEKCS